MLLNGITVGGTTTNTAGQHKNDANDRTGANQFYFVQLTDTHVMSKVFDPDESSMKNLQKALEHVCSFEKKPAFIVVTGDLTNWGGSWISGALNCLAFTSCLYKKDGRFYADANCSVPVYTTPGNHEYIYTRNLMNYHRYIKTDDRYIVNYSDATLFFLNSGPMTFDDGAGLTDSDMTWLDGALDNCTAHFKIVLMHHPAVNTRNEQGRMSGVIARNREAFVASCENHSVELVLTGHTHQARIFDGNEKTYEDPTSLNCSLYPTLFVQTDDCHKEIHYRNVTIIGNNVWLEHCVKVTKMVLWARA